MCYKLQQESLKEIRKSKSDSAAELGNHCNSAGLGSFNFSHFIMLIYAQSVTPMMLNDCIIHFIHILLIWVLLDSLLDHAKHQGRENLDLREFLNG